MPAKEASRLPEGYRLIINADNTLFSVQAPDGRESPPTRWRWKAAQWARADAERQRKAAEEREGTEAKGQ